MIEDAGFYNVQNATALLHHLMKCGVDYFCLSPGSRSTPLVLALNSLDNAKKMIHFDERGMAFHALGYAKATLKPVVIFVTSGTAVANLFPAIMEASLSRIPLIIITADRPQENFFCGANQTVDQAKIFSDYVRFQFDLSCSDPFITEKFIAGLASQAVYASLNAPAGPIHINVQFREPLFSKTSLSNAKLLPTFYERSEKRVSTSTLDRWASILSTKGKGVIVVGACPCTNKSSFLFSLANKLKWPILADVLSNCRQKDPCSISYYNLFLDQLSHLEPDCIIHFGDTLVSKALVEFLSGEKIGKLVPYYFQVVGHPIRHDPQNVVTHRLEADPFGFAEEILPLIEVKEDCTWLNIWKTKESEVSMSLEIFFNKEERLTEPKIFYDLQNKLKYPLVLSNSMPIREAATFFFPNNNTPLIFSNRGVSGSDGNIATAIGIAEGLKSPVFAVFGDIAALHDLNSLAMLKKAKYPVICVIINNQGGGIFSFLPIAKHTELLEEFFATAHDFEFENAAKFFNLSYSTDLQVAFKNPISQIIELRTNRKENVLHHEEINALFSQPSQVGSYDGK